MSPLPPRSVLLPLPPRYQTGTDASNAQLLIRLLLFAIPDARTWSRHLYWAADQVAAHHYDRALNQGRDPLKCATYLYAASLAGQTAMVQLVEVGRLPYIQTENDHPPTPTGDNRDL